MPKEVLIRYDRCLGCRSCQLACAVAHSSAGNLFGAVLNGEKPRTRIFVHQVGGYKAPLNCRHCQDAPCIDACIAGAMHKKGDGTVTNVGGEQQCTACWMCVMVCPYGIIRSDAEGTMALKCDRECRDETGIPACVRACPTGALVYDEVDDYSGRRRLDVLHRALSNV
ncbi:4Fe-4S dicluster domain-containing protein [Desulfofundulus thermosubterraneus]|uniref:Carbon-monoxide dehydrogenase iron sulfur subunit n=1 Tax=Desulfofundulus thermosubterraneus DSM 16057 TaxID=1121432 RepID=A0A1M6AJP5_9FIRM|nr:4Fe-4S dicluster domain-containing protein [Desulfofundulus thermosubterraneus]SHI36702.1 carbon-monoxide dehydrogenase iron sulfur subunit [Desulfofundulus thermosubterraneus DSM 16057]